MQLCDGGWTSKRKGSISVGGDGDPTAMIRTDKEMEKRGEEEWRTWTVEIGDDRYGQLEEGGIDCYPRRSNRIKGEGGNIAINVTVTRMR